MPTTTQAQKPALRRTGIIAIVALVIVAAVLGWYYYTTIKPVDVTGTIIVRGFTLVPTYPTNMTWTNTYDQRIYVANIWNVHGNVGSYNVSVPPGNYSVRVYFEGQAIGYFTRHNITVPSGNAFSVNIEDE